MLSKRSLKFLAFLAMFAVMFLPGISAAAPVLPGGMQWTQRTSGVPGEHLDGLAWSGRQYVAVGTSGTVLESSDGFSWNRVLLLNTNHLCDVAYGNGKFVAVGTNGTILVREAGAWSTITGVTTQHLRGVTWNGTKFIAVGDFGTVIASTNGHNWSLLVSGTTGHLRGVASNPVPYQGLPTGDMIVAVGIDTVIKSVDGGANWTYVPVPATLPTWNDVAWGFHDPAGNGGANCFVGAGEGGKYLVVEIGGEGAGLSVITTENLIDVAWSGRRLLAVGNNGTIIQSFDCDYWEWGTHSITTELLTDVLWDGRKFIAVGTNGTIITSTMVKRIYGSNRYQTAVNISKTGWPSATNVILARGDSYADALAGVPLAFMYNAPILLTSTSSLNQETKNEISRLGATNVIILGGPGAVSNNVEQTLQGMGLNVHRIWGSNRFATAQQISAQSPFASTNTAIIVYGHNFPDALAAAPYAARQGSPILLVNKDSIPPETQTALNTLPITHTVVVGGTGVISDAVMNQLPNPTRIYGSNRSETSVKLAQYFNPGAGEQYVATGLNFADAITGAALVAQQGSGIILVGNNVPQSVEDYILNSPIQYKPDGMTILGGPGAVSDAVYTRLQELLK